MSETATAASPKLLLTITEACERLSLSERTVYALVSAGKLQAVRVRTTNSRRGALRFTPEDLQDFVARLRTERRQAAAARLRRVL